MPGRQRPKKLYTENQHRLEKLGLLPFFKRQVAAWRQPSLRETKGIQDPSQWKRTGFTRKPIFEQRPVTTREPGVHKEFDWIRERLIEIPGTVERTTYKRQLVGYKPGIIQARRQNRKSLSKASGGGGGRKGMLGAGPSSGGRVRSHGSAKSRKGGKKGGKPRREKKKKEKTDNIFYLSARNSFPFPAASLPGSNTI